jgi:hypothetical protein
MQIIIITQILHNHCEIRLQSRFYKYINEILKKLRFNKNIPKSTTKMFLISRNCVDKIANIEFNYEILQYKEIVFKMSRSFDETIGKTMEKLVFNIIKKYEALSKEKYSLEITATLHNTNNEQILNETLNEHAWKEGYKVKINEKYFQVVVDLPSLKKISLPKQLIANMPVFIITDKEDSLFIDKCKFKWYISSNEFDKNEWELLNEGVNNRMIYLNSNTENKYLKVVCTPNDGTRDGLIVEIISNKTIENLLQLDELPMTDRHKLTTEKLSGNE